MTTLRSGFLANWVNSLRRGLDQRSYEALGKTHTLALDVGAGIFPHSERFSIVAKINPDLLQHCLAIAFDERQSLFAEHFVKGNIAPDISELGLVAARACGTARFGTASTAAGTAIRGMRSVGQ